MDEEKKVLMEQVKELTKIVELKDAEIQEQKFKIQDMGLLIQTVKNRTEELLSQEKRSKEELKTAKDLYAVVESYAADSLDREELLDEKEQELYRKEKELEEKEQILRKQNLKIQKLENKLSDQRHKLYMQFAILESLSLGIWLSAGLIGDLQSIVAFWKDRILGSMGITKVVVVAALIFLFAGLIGVGYRYVHRYLDFVSVEVSLIEWLIALMAMEFFNLNSVVIVVILEVIYLIIRSEVDARNKYSPYCKRRS